MIVSKYWTPAFIFLSIIFSFSGVDIATPSSAVNNTGVGDECPMGFYCPEGTTTPKSCTAGTYRYLHLQ